MQYHGPSGSLHDSSQIRGYLNDDFAVVQVGPVSFYLNTPEECDWLIAAACDAKRALAPAGDPAVQAALQDPAPVVRVCTLPAGHDGPHDDAPAGSAWCPATTFLDGDTAYCDRTAGHSGSHHAPGPDEGSEVAWSDAAAAVTE